MMLPELTVYVFVLVFYLFVLSINSPGGEALFFQVIAVTPPHPLQTQAVLCVAERQWSAN